MQILGIAVDRLGTASRFVVGAIALATIGVIIYIVMSAGGAAYAPAFTNLDARAAGDLQAALAGAGITSKLSDGGATVMVPSSKVDAARVAAGKAGVGDSRADWSSLEKNSLSQTDAQFQLRVQRVRSDMLAAQIEDIAGVCRATVNLAIPERSVFSADQEQTHASVAIETCGSVLSDTGVRGIVALVSNAVPGLSPQNISVVDQNGPLSTSLSGIGLANADAMAAQRTWEAQKTGIAQQALDRLVGVGAGTAIVAGQLNFDETTERKQTFGDDNGAIQSATEKEKLVQQGGASGGATGTSANIPGAAQTNGTASSQYDHNKATETNAIDTTQTDTKKVGGTPEKMSVAVVVSKKALQQVKADDEAGATQIVQDTIANAIGLDTADPNNKIAVSAVDSIPNPVAALKAAGVTVGGGGGAGAGGGSAMGGLIPAPFGGFVQPLMAGIGLLVLLFLVRKSLNRRQALLGETDASWLPALEAPPIKIDELMPAASGPSAGEVQAAEKKALQGRVEEIAQTRPSDVAAQLRGWLATEG